MNQNLKRAVNNKLSGYYSSKIARDKNKCVGKLPGKDIICGSACKISAQKQKNDLNNDRFKLINMNERDRFF